MRFVDWGWGLWTSLLLFRSSPNWTSKAEAHSLSSSTNTRLKLFLFSLALYRSRSLLSKPLIKTQDPLYIWSGTLWNSRWHAGSMFMKKRLWGSWIEDKVYEPLFCFLDRAQIWPPRLKLTHWARAQTPSRSFLSSLPLCLILDLSWSKPFIKTQDPLYIWSGTLWNSRWHAGSGFMRRLWGSWIEDEVVALEFVFCWFCGWDVDGFVFMWKFEKLKVYFCWIVFYACCVLWILLIESESSII